MVSHCFKLLANIQQWCFKAPDCVFVCIWSQQEACVFVPSHFSSWIMLLRFIKAGESEEISGPR